MGPASLQIELKSVRVLCDVDEDILKLFFSESILGPPNVGFGRENEKMDSKKPVSTSLESVRCYCYTAIYVLNDYNFFPGRNIFFWQLKSTPSCSGGPDDRSTSSV